MAGRPLHYCRGWVWGTQVDLRHLRAEAEAECEDRAEEDAASEAEARDVADAGEDRVGREARGIEDLER